MSDAELERLASAPGGPEFSDADLGVPRNAALRRIRTQRLAWRAVACAAAVLLLLLWIPRESKVETLALAVPSIAAPEIQVTPKAPPVIPVVRYRPHKQEQEQKPVVVKMLTDDPNIVIYWVTD